MPKIPTWTPQVEPPASTGMLTKNVWSQGREYEPLLGIADDLMKRAERIDKEKNILDAQAALTRLSDSEREMLTSERKLQGTEARDAVNRGTEWYEKEIERNAGGLSVEADKIYRLRASQVRDQGLNILAAHEAGQLQREKELALEGSVARVKDRIKTGALPEDIEVEIQALQQQVRETYRGVDTTSFESKIGEALYKDLLVEHAMNNPSNIDTLIAKYKDKVPEDTIKAVKDVAEKIEIEQTVDAEMERLRVTHGDNFDAMYKDIKSFDGSVKAKNALRTRVDDEFNTYHKLDAERKKQHSIALGKKVASLLDQKNYAELRKLILNDPYMDPGIRTGWILKLDEMADAAKNRKSKFNDEDSGVMAAVQSAIILHPEKLENSDILGLIGDGVPEDKAPGLCALLDKYKKEKDPDLFNCMQIVKAWQTKNAFSSDKAMNVYRAVELQNRLIQARKDFPEMDLMQGILEPYREELKKGKFDEVFKKIAEPYTPSESVDEWGTPSVRAKIKGKAPSKVQGTYSEMWQKLFPGKGLN